MAYASMKYVRVHTIFTNFFFFWPFLAIFACRIVRQDYCAMINLRSGKWFSWPAFWAPYKPFLQRQVHYASSFRQGFCTEHSYGRTTHACLVYVGVHIFPATSQDPLTRNAFYPLLLLYHNRYCLLLVGVSCNTHEFVWTNPARASRQGRQRYFKNYVQIKILVHWWETHDMYVFHPRATMFTTSNLKWKKIYWWFDTNCWNTCNKVGFLTLISTILNWSLLYY